MSEPELRTTLSPFEAKDAGSTPRKDRKLHTWFFFFIILACVAIASLFMLMRAPEAFTPDTAVTIPQGYTLSQIGNFLEQHAIIRSPVLFSILVSYEKKEKMIRSGEYLFHSPEPLWVVARRMASGDRGLETRKITIPEGLTTQEMSDILKKQLPRFDAESFTEEAQKKEGYLFPDTYFFYTTATSGTVIAAMEDNFAKKTDVLREEARANNINWSDTIIMASILEREAATDTDRRIISGILWKRIDQGMRLQVDAVLYYLTGKGSLELSLDDLKNDSPYNTYSHAGLPPGPIGNPGLDAIDAALHPKKTPYLYYLSDKNGVMHYATTFEEHKANKAKYLE